MLQAFGVKFSGPDNIADQGLPGVTALQQVSINFCALSYR